MINTRRDIPRWHVRETHNAGVRLSADEDELAKVVVDRDKDALLLGSQAQ